MRWCLSRCTLIVSTLDFLENPLWGLWPKTDLPNVSQFNEYLVIESNWKIIVASTIIHLTLNLILLKILIFKRNINAIRILKLIKNIKIRTIYNFITLRYKSHITKYIFIYTVKPLFSSHQNCKYIKCAALKFSYFSCWICTI